jgi:hypothetical protein
LGERVAQLPDSGADDAARETAGAAERRADETAEGAASGCADALAEEEGEAAADCGGAENVDALPETCTTRCTALACLRIKSGSSGGKEGFF